MTIDVTAILSDLDEIKSMLLVIIVFVGAILGGHLIRSLRK